jgi:hypothetical protein
MESAAKKRKTGDNGYNNVSVDLVLHAKVSMFLAHTAGRRDITLFWERWRHAATKVAPWQFIGTALCIQTKSLTWMMILKRYLSAVVFVV